MSGKIDMGKGRIEEAAGALIGNDKLRNKGKTDQAVGRAKQAATKVIDKVAKQMREGKATKKTGRKPRRIRRKALPRILAKGLPRNSAARTFLLRGGGKVEPILPKYSRLEPAKLSKRPGIRTAIRLHNLVGWKTDCGKDRIGIVKAFMADIAVVSIGWKTEHIRISRLTKLAGKAKKE